jgi:hypothetical protein
MVSIMEFENHSIPTQQHNLAYVFLFPVRGNCIESVTCHNEEIRHTRSALFHSWLQQCAHSSSSSYHPRLLIMMHRVTGEIGNWKVEGSSFFHWSSEKLMRETMHNNFISQNVYSLLLHCSTFFSSAHYTVICTSPWLIWTSPWLEICL